VKGMHDGLVTLKEAVGDRALAGPVVDSRSAPTTRWGGRGGGDAQTDRQGSGGCRG
jgi:hypothetical protein